MSVTVPHLKVVSSEINNPTESGRPRAAIRPEQLCYLADMIQQLKIMAEKGGLNTLSGILEVAYVEAKSHARNA